MSRPSWDEYFLAIAVAVSARADCLRAMHGAVIVDSDNRIVATGYNGTPPGSTLSCTAGDCPRAKKTKEQQAHNSGAYEDCINLHAEQNAIANAGRHLRGCRIYITGQPCPMCTKLIQAAGMTPIWRP